MKIKMKYTDRCGKIKSDITMYLKRFPGAIEHERRNGQRKRRKENKKKME